MRADYGPAMLDKLLVSPGSSVRLSSYKTDETFGWDKESGEGGAGRGSSSGCRPCRPGCSPKHGALLVVLQAMDAGGQGRRHPLVAHRHQPGGCAGDAFKVPVGRGAVHDYLWRVHAACPAKGEIGDLQPQPLRGCPRRAGQAVRADSAVEARYRPHRDFEQMLTDEGTHDREAVPQHVEGGATGSGSRIGSTTPTSGGSSAGAISTTAALWADFTKAYHGRPRPRRRPIRRRGTSCRPTGSGCATSPSPDSSSPRSNALDPQFPEPERGHRRASSRSVTLRRTTRRLTFCTVAL